MPLSDHLPKGGVWKAIGTFLILYILLMGIAILLLLHAATEFGKLVWEAIRDRDPSSLAAKAASLTPSLPGRGKLEDKEVEYF